MRLAAIILTYNEAEHVTACIASVRFADMVIVFDSFSTDQTIQLAQAAGATVIQNRFEDYARQRNAALQAVAATADWVLFVDADERVTPELAQEVREKSNCQVFPGGAFPVRTICSVTGRGAGAGIPIIRHVCSKWAKRSSTPNAAFMKSPFCSRIAARSITRSFTTTTRTSRSFTRNRKSILLTMRRFCLSRASARNRRITFCNRCASSGGASSRSRGTSMGCTAYTWGC
ncbi:MAG: glycosyltransferase [Chloroflexi bacterium]|nr:glycosyltransferase [Chloroflexota bacterium]